MIFSALSHTRVWGISWYVLFQTFVVILHIDRIILHIHMIAVRGRPELIPSPGPENKGLAFAIHNSATPTPKRIPVATFHLPELNIALATSINQLQENLSRIRQDPGVHIRFAHHPWLNSWLYYLRVVVT